MMSRTSTVWRAPSVTGIALPSSTMVRLFREIRAEDDYVKAFEEWEGSEDQKLWDSTAGDGLDDE